MFYFIGGRIVKSVWIHDHEIIPKSNKTYSTRQAEAPQAALAAGSVHSAGTADTRTTHRRNLQSNDDILNFVLFYYYLDILKILCPLQLNHKQDHNSILSTLTLEIIPVFFLLNLCKY